MSSGVFLSDDDDDDNDCYFGESENGGLERTVPETENVQKLSPNQSRAERSRKLSISESFKLYLSS